MIVRTVRGDVDPAALGPCDAHEHLFLVTRGTMSFLVGSEWLDLPEGTFLRIPAGVMHDFANRTTEPATTFSVTVPGISGFEASFASWAVEPPPER